jgi:nuclear pore complex protein Nup85
VELRISADSLFLLVSSSLHSHGLEEESRTLSRAVAERLIREKQYGLAVAFSVRAGDSRKLDGIADQVLDTYVRHGQSSSSSSRRARDLTDTLLSLTGSEAFITHVESIPTSLLDPTTSAGATSYLSSALSFLPLYHQFLVSYQQDLKDVAAGLLVNSFRNGLAPKSFWSVLMVDLVPLLEGTRSRSFFINVLRP